MKILDRCVVYCLNPDMPSSSHVNGRPYNMTFTVTLYQKKDGFYWTLDRGNRVKNLRGPFPTQEEALAGAKTDLGAF